MNVLDKFVHNVLNWHDFEVVNSLSCLIPFLRRKQNRMEDNHGGAKMKSPSELRKAWVKALRSGEYKHGEEYLMILIFFITLVMLVILYLSVVYAEEITISSEIDTNDYVIYYNDSEDRLYCQKGSDPEAPCTLDTLDLVLKAILKHWKNDRVEK